MIREAIPEDASQIYDAIKNTRYEGFERSMPHVNCKDTIASILDRIHSANSIVAVGLIDNRVEGCVVATIYPYFFNLDVMIGAIQLWNVTERCGACTLPVRMLRYTIDMCKQKGAQYIESAFVLGHSPKSVERIYKKLGMKQIETIYRMEV